MLLNHICFFFFECYWTTSVFWMLLYHIYFFNVTVLHLFFLWMLLYHIWIFFFECYCTTSWFWMLLYHICFFSLNVTVPHLFFFSLNVTVPHLFFFILWMLPYHISFFFFECYCTTSGTVPHSTTSIPFAQLMLLVIPAALWPKFEHITDTFPNKTALHIPLCDFQVTHRVKLF